MENKKTKKVWEKPIIEEISVNPEDIFKAGFSGGGPCCCCCCCCCC